MRAVSGNSAYLSNTDTSLLEMGGGQIPQPMKTNVAFWPLPWVLDLLVQEYIFVPCLLQANPPQFDRAEDLAHLRYVNESSVLHTLRQRYGSNLIHTYAGGSMVVINPMAPLAIHSEKVSFKLLSITFVPCSRLISYSICFFRVFGCY